jgi:threonine/homoserine/homoserine lactone efflux protein
MPTLEIDWPLWAATMIPLIFSAGPGNIMVAASGARSGVRGSLAFIFGLDGTYFLLAVAVGLGLGQLILSHPVLSHTLKVLGILYIFYLAWRFWVSKPASKSDGSSDFQFRDGVFVQLTNSKGVVMLMVMFSEFFTPSAHMAIGIVVMSAALVGLNFMAHLMWASFGLVLNKAMSRHAWLQRAQSVIFASMMMSVGVWLAIREMA